MTDSSIITRSEDGVLIVYPQEPRIIDESQIQNLGNDIMGLIHSAKEDKMLLNFSTVGFMGSAMIGKLILISKKSKASQLDMRICGLNENIMEVFKLMKLDKVFEVYEDEAIGLKAFKDRKKKWYV